MKLLLILLILAALGFAAFFMLKKHKCAAGESKKIQSDRKPQAVKTSQPDTSVEILHHDVIEAIAVPAELESAPINTLDAVETVAAEDLEHTHPTVETITAAQASDDELPKTAADTVFSLPTETEPTAVIPAESAKAADKTAEQIPEDSILRRHYLSTRQAEKNAISNPYPTDSVLRRHYESSITSL